MPFVDDKNKISYYHCKDCEYIFKHPSLYKDIEDQKERYDLHDNSAMNDGYRAYFQRFIDFMLPLVENSKDALDFGCGESSLLASMLEEEGIACDYYDPIYHPNGLEDTKKYDLIVSTEVFEHLQNPKKIFEMLLKRLNVGGYLAIQTEFHTNEISSFLNWYYIKDPTHIVFFRAHTFEVLSSLYNCKVVDDNGKNMIVIKKK
ncbi:Methyltransferase-related protein [hydrothermal vent metagenome]|uniref:Methyltransferase-related protein n=1 Tax=hydrothermal vent metagenome TaxID=652676 RepID=A0A1W1EDQ9_9ZZZZ